MVKGSLRQIELGGGDIELSDPCLLPVDPLVSVWMITYNQAPYISQALDSVLRQCVDFPYEICLGEDGSSDGTREICIEYASAHPDKVRLILRDRNNPERQKFRAPFMYNSAKTFDACRGKYIAMLEGDDYWIEPDKLQRQAKFLEAQPDYSSHASNALKCEGDSLPGRDAPCCNETAERDFDLNQLLYNNPVPTCTVMFRNGLIPMLPRWFHSLAMGDWPIHVLNAKRGKMRYDPRPTACYRIHCGGAWSTLGRLRQMEGVVEARTAFESEFAGCYRRLIRKLNCLDQLQIAVQLERDGDIARARRLFFRAFRGGSFRPWAVYPITRTWLRLYFPGARTGGWLWRLARSMRKVGSASAGSGCGSSPHANATTGAGQ